MADDGGAPGPRPVKVTEFVEKVRRLRDTLSEGLVERDVPIRLALLAALAGEHLLMVGPPGTAKSLVARRLHLAFEDATYFERLLTRFTVPEELFGPLSIKGLEQDRYERLTQAYLPKASIAFLDEIFKANSAILNALLTLLNEREFDNGAVREKTPLVTVVGASNELPDGEELDALFDRFLLRLHVGHVSKDGFRDLLGLRGQAVPAVAGELMLTKEELSTVQDAAEAVEVPDDVVALLCDLREWCTAEGIQVSDRRWRKIVKLLQVSAATNGRSRVSIWDCWLLQHCLWDEPEAREKVYRWYAARVGASAAMDPSRLTKIVVAWEARLKADNESRSQMRDKGGNPLYRQADGHLTRTPSGKVRACRNEEPLFLAPDNTRAKDSNGNWRDVRERTYGGLGFTRNELTAAQVLERRWDRWVSFDEWSDASRYLADPNNFFIKDGDLPSALEPTRQKWLYIEGCLRSLDEVRAKVEKYRTELDAHIASLEDEIHSHLWVTPEFSQPAAERLGQTQGEVEQLLNRVALARAGFEGLPREKPIVADDDGEQV